MKNIHKLLIAACFFAITHVAVVNAQEPKLITVQSEVSEATIFINGAQVFRKKSVDLAAGTSSLKFTSLSPYIDSKSIQVKTNNQVMILSVNFQVNYKDSVDPDKERREIQSKLDALDEKLKTENAKMEISHEELAFLKDNRIIGGKNQEVSFANLQQISNFYSTKISANKLNELEIQKNIDRITRDRNALQAQLNESGNKSATPSGEIVVNVKTENPVKADFEISYFTDNAGWLPSYDIRAAGIDDPIELVYKANVHQNTKESWKNIKLKLSSANPNQGTIAPKLKTYYLNYSSIPPRYSLLSNQVTGQVYDNKTNEPVAFANIVVQGTTIGTNADVNGNFSLTLPPNSTTIEVRCIGYSSGAFAVSGSPMRIGLTPALLELKEVQMISGAANIRGSRAESSEAYVDGLKVRADLPVVREESQTSAEFEIKIPYTVPSDNKNLLVEIDRNQIPATFEYECVPKIDKDAFLVAHVTNWEKYNLLAGEANLFFENTFVGKSVLDTRYISDTLDINFGRDKNVVITREKIKEFTTRQFLGSKKEETRAWKISVRNNKRQNILLNISDQIPVSTMEEIEVNADDISGGTLTKETGEVKWKQSLAQGEKKELTLKYRIKYPKDRTLVIE